MIPGSWNGTWIEGGGIRRKGMSFSSDKIISSLHNSAHLASRPVFQVLQVAHLPVFCSHHAISSSIIHSPFSLGLHDSPSLTPQLLHITLSRMYLQRPKSS